MTLQEFQAALERHESAQQYLYVRGFCLTSSRFDTSSYPFFQNWNETKVGELTLYTHKWTSVSLFHSVDKDYFLIGHAYDPFAMCFREEEILQKLSQVEDFWEATNDLTGVFCVGYVQKDRVCFTCDAAGQQLAYYGIVNQEIFIASHSQLVADLCRLQMDDYVAELIHYRFYRFFGPFLPGDLSPYKELTRAQCNFVTELSKNGHNVRRFWPKKPIETCETNEKYLGTIERISGILRNNMALIAKKWPEKRTAISVTGGMDSKTTMACAKDYYSEFRYFSYDSLPDEKVDAEAAGKLCGLLGLEHTVYGIPQELSSDIPLALWREIFNYNSGKIGGSKDNDIKKRVFFSKNEDFDVEVKSWVDEIGRARYHKRFAKRKLPVKPNPRYLSCLYKVFFHNRKLLKQTDDVFRKYLDTYYNHDVMHYVPWWDLHYWEFSWNAGEGLFLTSEQRFAYEITIPYNNRKLLELMLTVPLEKRIADQIQKDVIEHMNPDIAKTGIHVQDVSHTKNRARIERLYLEINSRLPF